MGRALDSFLAALALIVSSPVLLLVALFIRLADGGPVFYRSRRVGLAGQTFMLYKFRTMVVHADKLGGGITSADDPRVFYLGRLLRKYKIDEMPQFFNVLNGDMAIVGPRPEDPRYVAIYTPEQRSLLAIRPGITSLASVIFRHEEQMLSGDDWERQYVNDILPRKLSIEIEYASRRTFFTDLGVLLKTVSAIFS